MQKNMQACTYLLSRLIEDFLYSSYASKQSSIEDLDIAIFNSQI
jgi:hypothetical protein